MIWTPAETPAVAAAFSKEMFTLNPLTPKEGHSKLSTGPEKRSHDTTKKNWPPLSSSAETKLSTPALSFVSTHDHNLPKNITEWLKSGNFACKRC